MIHRISQPVNIASLVFFRIAFGILGFADVLNTYIYYHWMVDAYDPEKFHFRYYGFEWVHPLPEPLLSIIFLTTCALAILVALGKWYRISSLLFAFGFTYTFLLEKAHYLNHGYLFCWVSFVMAFLPAHRQFSGDVLRRPGLKADTVPYWCLFLLQFLMGVAYFYGGIAKLNADWLQAIPLKQWLEQKSGNPLIGPLLGQEWVAYFMAYGGLLLDLTVVFFLFFRKTRPWAFAAVLFFHLMNHLTFNIGIFPFLSVALTALYFPPDFPMRIYERLEGRLSFLLKIRSWWEKRTAAGQAADVPLWQQSPRWRAPITLGILAIVLFHLLVPLRHHLFPGDVAWTEEGHRYSWRMMLRSKQGYGTFLVRDKHTGTEEEVDPVDWLEKKQLRNLYTHPDMILQFAHHLRDVYQAKGQDVAIFADIRVELNFREYHTYIDPTTDLAQEEWHFFRHSDWVLPEKR
ncbi:MAG: HTTM domain-containing protein [Phaeodactylibacter sp.]|nr:HTTM domain-containing protein [Phaeodactylibacter sp.]MCB9047915.1 HTTM domain-containing protein [Lewinellaceae bacterium]